MKWGTKYGPEYVNRLYAMVLRHLKGDFSFVCLTDRTEGIRAEVRCFPIPELTLPNGEPERGWKKLTTFSPVLVNEYGLSGTALFLDLDVVIVNDITPFFEVAGEFLVIHDWKRPWRITGNSSVYRFELGRHPDVLAYFRANTEKVRAEHRNEQEYLSAFMHDKGVLTYWPEAWCPSFKYHGIPDWPTNYWTEPFVPEGARIMVFHGECNPPDALAGRRNRAFRFIRPANWVARFWTS
jgi:hypothetical protein